MTLLDDIFVYLNEDMPNGAREVVCPNADGTYTILINGSLTGEQQADAFRHALWHIENNDFERVETLGIQAIEYEAHKQ